MFCRNPSSKTSVASLWQSGAQRHRRVVDQPQSSNVDGFIAGALKSLSLEERNQIYHEIHGVAEELIETPTLLKQSLHALEVLLQQSNDETYQLALQQNPAFVQDPKFRLRFLRTDRFAVIASRDRMLRYLKMKRQLFGDKVLTKEIAFEDLTREDVRLLKSGCHQVLPERDRSGRAIIFFAPFHPKLTSADSYVRVCMYMELRDEETQKKGQVMVIYGLGNNLKLDPKLPPVMHSMKLSMPGFIASIHHCFDNRRLAFIMDLLIKISDKETGCRVKIHYGSRVECAYSLMTYGIPEHVIPVGEDGTIKVRMHLEWLKAMRKRSALQMQCHGAKVVEIPSHSDFLLGRGKRTQNHIGNMRLHTIVDDHLQEYKDKVSNHEKTEISMKVVGMLRGGFGRFLSQETGVWLEIPDHVAREVVSQLFRSRRKRSKEAATTMTTASPATSSAVVANKAPRSRNSPLSPACCQDTPTGKRAKVTNVLYTK